MQAKILKGKKKCFLGFRMCGIKGGYAETKRSLFCS